MCVDRERRVRVRTAEGEEPYAEGVGEPVQGRDVEAGLAGVDDAADRGDLPAAVGGGVDVQAVELAQGPLGGREQFRADRHRDEDGQHGGVPRVTAGPPARLRQDARHV